MPRVAACLHICEMFFASILDGRIDTTKEEIGLRTLKAAERLVAVSNSQKRTMLEVSISETTSRLLLAHCKLSCQGNSVYCGRQNVNRGNLTQKN